MPQARVPDSESSQTQASWGIPWPMTCCLGWNATESWGAQAFHFCAVRTPEIVDRDRLLLWDLIGYKIIILTRGTSSASMNLWNSFPVHFASRWFVWFWPFGHRSLQCCTRSQGWEAFLCRGSKESRTFLWRELGNVSFSLHSCFCLNSSSARRACIPHSTYLFWNRRCPRTGSPPVPYTTW